jgi:hypothetical protein
VPDEMGEEWGSGGPVLRGKKGSKEEGTIFKV